MTECVDNNPFEVLQRSLMNTLRFDQIHGHKKKNMMRQNAYLQKNSVIFSQRNRVCFFPLLEHGNDTKRNIEIQVLV